jgi:hypothetical protein
MTKTERAEKQKIFREHLDALGEHFDNVQLFVSFMAEGTTKMIQDGRGNLFARQGQIRDYLIAAEEIVRYDQRIDCEEENE